MKLAAGVPLDYTGETLDPGQSMFFAMVSLFILALICAATVVAYRRFGGMNTPVDLTKVPPVPQAHDYDPNLTPHERLRELNWIESLMQSPSYERERPLED